MNTDTRHIDLMFLVNGIWFQTTVAACEANHPARTPEKTHQRGLWINNELKFWAYGSVGTVHDNFLALLELNYGVEVRERAERLLT